MAIKTIDELDPVQAGYTVGENDVLPIAVENNGSYTTKKIKASALGGGGGGGAGVFVMHFDGQSATESIADAWAAYQDGQYVVMELNTGDGCILGTSYSIGEDDDHYPYVGFFLVGVERDFYRIEGSATSGGIDTWSLSVAQISWQSAN